MYTTIGALYDMSYRAPSDFMLMSGGSPCAAGNPAVGFPLPLHMTLCNLCAGRVLQLA